MQEEPHGLRAPGQKGVRQYLRLGLVPRSAAAAAWTGRRRCMKHGTARLLRGLLLRRPPRKGSAASWPYAILCPALMLLPRRLVDLSALAGSYCLKRGEDDAGF